MNRALALVVATAGVILAAGAPTDGPPGYEEENGPHQTRQTFVWLCLVLGVAAFVHMRMRGRGKRAAADGSGIAQPYHAFSQPKFARAGGATAPCTGTYCSGRTPEALSTAAGSFQRGHGAAGRVARPVATRPHRRPSGRTGPLYGMGNSFGRTFRISTWGESHGGGVGVTIDGCPPRVPIDVGIIQKELDRRRPGQSRLTTPRDESDQAEILSGVDRNSGLTLGTPIAMLVRNKDQRSHDYKGQMTQTYRPSHADATYDAKYGIRDIAGGGRSSARETIGRVAGAAVAREVLRLYSNVEIIGYVKKVQEIEADVDPDTVTLDMVEDSLVRCPDPKTSDAMIDRIDSIRKTGNSVGGVVEIVARNVPVGLGSPVFDKLEAELAKAMLSLPAAKGFEIGSGFEGTMLTGHDHNDEFYIDPDTGRTRTRTNRSGGVQGGISNGESIVIRVAFKPTSTIGRKQKTVTRDGEEVEMRGKGRHDPCVLPRAAPMAEAMVALVLVDALMQQKAQCDLLPNDSVVQSGFNRMGPPLSPGPARARSSNEAAVPVVDAPTEDLDAETGFNDGVDP